MGIVLNKASQSRYGDSNIMGFLKLADHVVVSDVLTWGSMKECTMPFENFVTMGLKNSVSVTTLKE